MTAVLPREIADYADTVRRVRERNKDRVEWSILRAEFDAVVARCHALEKEASLGLPYQRHMRRAASVFVQIAESVRYERALDLCAGLWMFQQLRPSRFAGLPSDRDRPFQFAMVNILRREARADRTFRTGAVHPRRVRRTEEARANLGDFETVARYREMDKASRLAVYRLVQSAFGRAAVHIAKLEVDRATEETRRKDAVTAALASIT
jgi:hypothetical protein